MTDTHICNLCPLGERRHEIWANRRLEDQACPVYVQSKKPLLLNFETEMNINCKHSRSHRTGQHILVKLKLLICKYFSPSAQIFCPDAADEKYTIKLYVLYEMLGVDIY